MDSYDLQTALEKIGISLDAKGSHEEGGNIADGLFAIARAVVCLCGQVEVSAEAIEIKLSYLIAAPRSEEHRREFEDLGLQQAVKVDG